MSKLFLPDRPKLWTPDLPRPVKDSRGNITVHRPLNLIDEVEKFLLEEKTKLFRKLGFPPLLAGAAAGNWTFTNNSRTYMLNGAFDFDSDTFKCALFLSTSNLGASTTTYAGVTNEHANGNGYLTGGVACTMSLSGTTTVTVDETTNPAWTASGGSITARFAALYEVGGNVVCYCLLDSTPADVTVTDTNTLTISIHANGVFQLA